MLLKWAFIGDISGNAPTEENEAQDIPSESMKMRMFKMMEELYSCVKRLEKSSKRSEKLAWILCLAGILAGGIIGYLF